MYMLDDYVAADDDYQVRENAVKVISPPREVGFLVRWRTLAAMAKLSAAMGQAQSWEGGWTAPKQMADPVTPEATESFGNRGNLKDLKNTAMGGIMGLHQSNPDEGFMRAAMATSEFPKYFPHTTSHRIGGTHLRGYLPMSPTSARAFSRSDQVGCTDDYLQYRYQTLKKALAETQFRAGNDPYRFMELVRAEELSNFLNRADNSSISREELSKLGEALAALLNAGRGARTDYTAPLRHSEAQVPAALADSIGMTQQVMRDVVAYAFRCRATTFLMARPNDGYREKRPVSAYAGWNEAAGGAAGVSPDSQRPRVSFEGVSAEPAEDPKKEASPEPGDAEQETLEQPRVSKSASLALDDAVAIVASAGAIFVAGRGGLKRFDLPDLQLMASEPYAGTADPPGYADLAAGPGFIVCVDLDGCVFRYDATTCELQAKRAYQPSVMEHSQRIVACQLEKSSKPIIGLEGGVGGASRLAASRDGVVTSYAAGTLSLAGRCRLQEGPANAALGIRAVFLSAYQRLYCAVLSSVYVLATPAMYQLARLRGGPRVPVFGSVSAVVESNAGDVAFVADVGGPSIHVWSTKSWQWLARVELSLALAVAILAMKFAKTLEEKLLQEWRPQYVNYKMLKKALKLEEAQAIPAFCNLLEAEIKKVQDFMMVQQDSLWQVLCGVDVDISNPLRNALVSVDGCESMVESIQHIQSYVALNHTAVRKIIKKFDKRFHVHFQEVIPMPVMSNLVVNAGDIGTWLLKPAEQCLRLVRTFSA
eukprot:symbB.v1.2.038579.t1/scaffold6063.1/size21276/1